MNPYYVYNVVWEAVAVEAWYTIGRLTVWTAIMGAIEDALEYSTEEAVVDTVWDTTGQDNWL